MKELRKRYKDEYKNRAVELSKQRVNSSLVANKLGIQVSMLYEWQRAKDQGEKKGNKDKERSEEEREIIRLRKALKEAQIELDI